MIKLELFNQIPKQNYCRHIKACKRHRWAI